MLLVPLGIEIWCLWTGLKPDVRRPGDDRVLSDAATDEIAPSDTSREEKKKKPSTAVVGTTPV